MHRKLDGEIYHKETIRQRVACKFYKMSKDLGEYPLDLWEISIPGRGERARCGLGVCLVCWEAPGRPAWPQRGLRGGEEGEAGVCWRGCHCPSSQRGEVPLILLCCVPFCLLPFPHDHLSPARFIDSWRTKAGANAAGKERQEHVL